MKFQKFFATKLVAIVFAALTAAAPAMGQTARPTPKPTPQVVMPADERPYSVARGNNLYCAGYIQKARMDMSNRIIGSDQEAETFNYDQNDYMWINMGASKGVHVGDTFAVVRPRGKTATPWTPKHDLGFFVQEIGALEVVSVKRDVSVARIKTSCDAMYLGDVVQLIEKRTSPLIEKRPSLDLFKDPSGKAEGQILMGRDGAELLTKDFIAYVDLGIDNHVQVGDRLTIFRRLGEGNLNIWQGTDGASATDPGFESDVYRGGIFSNQSGRKRGDQAQGQTVTQERAKRGRQYLRKVVGEAVVLNVKERTSTVVITRTAQEIHPGDFVEIQ